MRSSIMILFSSGRHEPQLVPARKVRPMSPTLAAPLLTALRTAPSPTWKQAQTTGSVSSI